MVQREIFGICESVFPEHERTVHVQKESLFSNKHGVAFHQLPTGAEGLGCIALVRDAGVLAECRRTPANQHTGHHNHGANHFPPGD